MSSLSLSSSSSVSSQADSSTQTQAIAHRRLSITSIGHLNALGAVSPTDEIALKRHIGLFSGICFIIGTIIGSGIFVSPKGVLQGTQSVGLCLIVWTVSGFISLLSALCYAEIGTVIPRNGAEVAYIKEGIGSVHELTGDVLAYLYIWTSTFLVKPMSVTILSLVFSNYFLSSFMTNCKPSDELVKLLSVFMILVLINMNSLSVSAASRANIIFVICKVSTLVIIIIGGLVRIGQGHTQNLKHGFAGTTNKPLDIAVAFYKGLFAYGGWAGLNSMTEEIKNPKRNLWLAIVIALPSVIILYVLANVSYFTVMNEGELLASTAVAVTWGEIVLGRAVVVLPVLISLCALGSSNAVLYEAGRYCLVGAQYGYLPEIFACIQKQRLTPLPGIVLQGVLAIIFCIPSDIYSLIDSLSFTAWLFYGLTFIATLICKFTKRDAYRVISVPIPLIIVIIMVAIYLVIIPVVASPSIKYLIAVLIIVSGLLFYYPFVYRKIELQFMKKINSSLQNFFHLQRAQINIS